MSRVRRAALAVAAAVVVAACSSSSPKSASTTTTAPTATSSTASAAPGPAPAPTPAAAWAAYHHDAARTGRADDQTPIGQVHKLWESAALDGNVYAEPLIVGERLLVATQGNSVYALDAASGRQVWRAQLGAPVNGSTLPCGNVNPSGITGTPIADPSNNVLYVVAFLADGPHHELFAVDLDSGAVRWHRPVDPPGLSGSVEQERGALAITGGRVYIPYGGLFGDCGPYKGALVSVAVDGQGPLTSYVVPTSRGGGIWHPGGPAADPSGDLWVATGNTQSSGAFDYGNAVIRLSPKLEARDYFAPREWARLNESDTDLGSVGPALVGTNRVLTAGKSGVAYLLDRGRLGNVGGAITSTQACSAAFGTPAVLGTVVFLPCTDGLVAVRTDGDRLVAVWRRAGRVGPPILAASMVWVLGGDGRLSAVDPAGGQERFGAQLDAPASRFVSMSAAGGRLFVAPKSKVTAFALR
jgi:outer membrane protein assembly factor BamB